MVRATIFIAMVDGDDDSDVDEELDAYLTLVSEGEHSSGGRSQAAFRRTCAWYNLYRTALYLDVFLW